MSSDKLLFVTMDPLTDRMPGPAIRAWHLAGELAAGHDVVLASCGEASRTSGAMRVTSLATEPFECLLGWADVVVSQSSIVRRYPSVADADIPLAVDLYDPYHLENLEPDGRSTPAEHAATVAHLTGVVNDDLRRGDYFFCASRRQRDFWLGSLGALGRVNPATYEGDPSLRRLLGVVPFGVPRQPPERSAAPGLFDRWPGLARGDEIVVWGGGVYNWFDPLSLVRAVDLLRRRRPRLRLVFLGMRNPNPEIPDMRVAAELRRLVAALGLEGTHVFFNDSWVPYEDRANFLLDARVGVSTHLEHVETRFSFRTRVLDYLWAGLPTVLTGGDDLSERIGAAGLGVTVAAGDVEGIAAGIAAMLDRPPPPGGFDEMRRDLAWDRVVEDLAGFCRRPARAADLVSDLEPAPLAVTPGPAPAGGPA